MLRGASRVRSHSLSSVAPHLTCDPVFDRCWWLYSLYRERLFTDHTDTIATAFAPLLRSHPHLQLLEVGCGPGFYSRRLAARYPYLQAVGIDTSPRLVLHARQQASRAHLDNCRFLHGDAQELCDCIHTADAAIASRFFLVLTHPHRVLSVIFETLRPGGLFFVAEPLSPLRTALPMWLMRAAETLSGRVAAHPQRVRCHVLSHLQFEELIAGKPWSKVEIWRDKRYQYALCEKAS